MSPSAAPRDEGADLGVGERAAVALAPDQRRQSRRARAASCGAVQRGQEALAARQRRQAEALGDRLRDVVERRARAEVVPGGRARPKASSGTYSRVWSVPGVVGSLP